MSELPERKRTNRFLIRIDTAWDEDGEVTEYEDIVFAPGKLLLAEAIEVEKTNYFGNLTLSQLTSGLLTGSALATGASIWIMHKRSNPSLKPGTEQFVSENVHVMDPDFLPEHGGIPFGQAAGDFGPEPEPAEEAPKDLEPATKAAPGKKPSNAGGSRSPRRSTTPKKSS